MFWYVVALQSNDIFVARFIVVAAGESHCNSVKTTVTFLSRLWNGHLCFISNPRMRLCLLPFKVAKEVKFAIFARVDQINLYILPERIVYYRSKERVTSPSWSSVSNHMAIPFISLSLLYSVCKNQLKIYLRTYGINIAFYPDAQSALQHFVGDFAVLLI